MHTTDVGNFVIAVYKPHKGKEESLLEVLKDHLPLLRSEKLATNFPSLYLRGTDGTVLEIFEWVSLEAVRSAHTNPVVIKLWERFNQVCDYDKLSGLKEAETVFPHFERIEL